MIDPRGACQRRAENSSPAVASVRGLGGCESGRRCPGGATAGAEPGDRLPPA